MAGYLGASPVPQTIQKKESFTATAGQTTFNTTGYTSGNFINVFLNGVRLVNGTDYTATNGSDIVLGSAAAASDVLDFETFNEFSLVDHEFTNSIALKNATHEDTDGGRESKLSFKGEQSGGEISTLAEIQGSHDGTADDQKGDLIFKTNDGSDNNAPTEAARIDSSQNLLVGKTAVGLSTTGIDLRSNGLIQAIRDGGTTVELNRQTSDGTLIDLRKDNSTVGSIATQGSRLSIGSGDTNLNFNASANSMYPISDPAAGTLSDGAIDLGAATARFKDLYLGGGVVFDAVAGNATSNTLNDYEEGSFTPTYTCGSGTITTTSNAGKYVKIGDLVHCHFRIRSTGVSGINGAIGIAGFPFTAVSDARSSGSKWFARDWASDMPNFSFGIAAGTTTANLYKHAMNTSASSVGHPNFSTGGDNNVLEASITYQVA